MNDRLSALVERALPGNSPEPALAAIAEIDTLVDELRRYHVQAARQAGATWAEIGGRLGVTAQSAHGRFARTTNPQVVD